MNEAGIARILVASLHEGITDLLPARLDFYENWLNPDGLWHGTIGLAPVLAVLSFLRQEGDAYRLVTRRAGEYTAEWTVNAQSSVSRSLIRSLPPWLRVRTVLRLARRAIQGTNSGNRTKLRVRRGQGTFEVRNSLFCNVRDASHEPLCDFYAASISRFLELYSVPGDVRLGRCRALGDPSCLITVALDARRRSAVIGLTSST